MFVVRISLNKHGDFISIFGLFVIVIYYFYHIIPSLQDNTTVTKTGCIIKKHAAPKNEAGGDDKHLFF